LKAAAVSNCMVRWAALCSLLAASCVSTARAEDLEAHRLADIGDRVRACDACHGEQGRSADENYTPSIAGKTAGYLRQQLLSFRDGRRPQRIMQQMLAVLSDEYLGEIAAYYAAQPPARPERTSSASDATLAIGRALVERGDPARELPACRSCHGGALTGVEPATPGLIGLRAEYLMGQLGAWRAGVRRAVSPDCMAHVARLLTREESAAVAAWIASLPVSERHTAQPQLPHPPPLRCGAVP
jgi:cytochrome c553